MPDAPPAAVPEPGPAGLSLTALPPFTPDLYRRAWCSVPHPTLPLLATTHGKAVTVFSLSTFSQHSQLTGGHERSVRSATWKPDLPPHKLCLVTGSFDSTAALWRWEQKESRQDAAAAAGEPLEVDVGAAADDDDDDNDGWEFTLVLEGQEHEIKSVAFSPAGQYLATCSRDKSVWIWEDVGAEDDDEWETVAVLSEHDGDVKAVAWCPDVPGRAAASRGRHSADVLASASYDNTVRIWREDSDAEWVCVAVLDGHRDIVWGVQWEPDPDNRRFPRLMTWSSDKTVRIWTLREHGDDDDDDAAASSNAAAAGGAGFLGRTGLGGIPNTMRRSPREEWDCTAVLPAVHSREVYWAAWSGVTGRVASTGGDGVVAVYAEDQDEPVRPAPAEPDGEAPATNGRGPATTVPAASNLDGRSGSGTWRVLATLAGGHGPYEINHVTWCRRFDAGSAARGVEEMLVTTGDDGVVRPWQLAAEA